MIKQFFSRIIQLSFKQLREKFEKIIYPPTTPLPSITIGRFSYGGYQVIKAKGDNPNIGVHIGKYTSFAPNVKIFIGGEHNANWITTSPLRVLMNLKHAYIDGHPRSKGNVNIGNDVWIGYNTVILSGVTIGDGAIIGANSLVAKNVEPYTIVGGNPIKLIRKRFRDDQIQKLMSIKWWDWDPQKVKDSVDILCSPNIDEFLAKFS